MDVAAIERTLARWQEYGPLNTITERLADGAGGRCALGDIAAHELGVDDAQLVAIDAALKGGATQFVAERIAAELGLELSTVLTIAMANDAARSRPTWLLEAIILRPDLSWAAYLQEGDLVIATEEPGFASIGGRPPALATRPLKLEHAISYG